MMSRRASSAVAVAAVAVAVLAGAAAAAVYEVGDKAGWTVMGNPDYAGWARTKKFHVGDVVVFTYLKQFHNVMAVSKTSYSSCDTSKPIATWSTGKDSVVLNTTGPHYFLCGFPGHCAAGQKVEIDVRSSSHSSSAAPSESPATAPSPAGSSGTEPSSSSGAAAAAPSPHGNAAPPARTVGGSVALAASVLSMAVAAVLA